MKLAFEHVVRPNFRERNIYMVEIGLILSLLVTDPRGCPLSLANKVLELTLEASFKQERVRHSHPPPIIEK